MKNVRNEEGQALIELIIFLPLIVTLYSVISGFASSINGSINQQKITRAYFYYRLQNNSTTPFPKSGEENWQMFGMFFIGWRDKLVKSETPVMPCYKISIPFKDDQKDKCEDTYSDHKTLWVRVGTAYGICGGTYVNENGKIYLVPEKQGLSYHLVIDRSGCTIQ